MLVNQHVMSAAVHNCLMFKGKLLEALQGKGHNACTQSPGNKMKYYLVRASQWIVVIRKVVFWMNDSREMVK